MVYLHLYETEQEFQNAYNGEGYDEPWISYTEQSERCDYNKEEEEEAPTL